VERMENVKTCIAKAEISQYGEVFANKNDKLTIIGNLKDGRIWCENRKLDKEFAVLKDEITILNEVEK